MAATYANYAGDGSTRTFSVPFPYLDQSHVILTVDGVEDTGRTWDTPYLLRASSIPAFGAVVRVARVTPVGISPVDFVDGSVLSEADLDILVRYATYISEEASEVIDGVAETALAGAAEATAAATAAAASEATGVAAKDTAVASAATAVAAKDTSVAAKDTAVAAKDTAVASAATAGAAKDTAVASAATAVAAKDTAVAAKDTAVASEAVAVASAATAVASKDSATASATLAATYAQLAYLSDYGLLAGAPTSTDYGSI